MSEQFFKVEVLSDEAAQKRGWTVEIEGELKDVRHIRLENPKVGVLEYGNRPEGYDGWVFKENGGGGAITIPFARKDGQLLVGVILEDRKNMAGKQWCAIGGLVDPGESHFDAALREALEESGLLMRPELLPGLPTNSNRLFFVADPSADEGVHAYAVEVPFAALELEDGGFYAIKADLPAELRGKIFQKSSGHVRFMTWKEAINRSPDALFRAGISQLLANVL